jgi:hypothetical protein
MSSKILDDFLGLPEFAAEVKRHPRSVRRWMNQANGLPYTWLGNQVIIHVPTAREWLLSRMRRPNPRASTPRRRLPSQPLEAAE